MPKKLLLRWVLISIPVLLLAIQTFWRPFEHPYGVKKGFESLVPPLFVVFRYFDFNQNNALDDWEEKVFEGRVAYWIDFKDSKGFLHAKSEQASSAIFHRLRYDLKEYPMLSWKWRIKKFPNKDGVTGHESLDDFGARMYVVFLPTFFIHLECVEYVWDEYLPAGTIVESPFSDKIKQLVIRSGPSKDDKWAPEKRNVLEDYELLFGKKPSKKVAAIAIMTDSDGTKGEAEAFFDDIQIGK